MRNLFDTSLYNLAAGLVVPIFNAGRLSAGRDLAVARREELLAAYRSLGTRQQGALLEVARSMRPVAKKAPR